MNQEQSAQVETPDQSASQPDSSPEPTNAPAASQNGFRVFNSWMRDFVFSIVVSFFIILFVYQPVKVEGGSMEPGLEDQERIFINKLVYRWESINRGDIIVFRYPRDPRKSFIKRVIGVSGDRVRISFGHVYLNGKRIEEDYVPAEFLDSRSYPEIVVPPNSYFVLGDHRSMSNDSRDFGPVARSYIYGKAVFGYWPMEKLGLLR
jgi:signal peptidase I